MRIKLTDQQRDVGVVAAKFLEERIPLARLRELADEAEAGKSVLAIEESTWASCAALGWFGLGIPASHGGVGCGPVEEVILFTELGRHLAPGPFVSTVMAGWIATGADEPDLAADFVEGRRRAGLEVGRFVQDGEPGGYVVSVTGSTLELCEIRSSVPVPSVDGSVRLSMGAKGTPVAAVNDPQLRARAQLLVSAMELGIARATLDMSVEYAKVRTQFDRPIGTFQAVKHRCADMAMRAHAAQAQVLFASFQVESRSSDAPFHAAAAKTIATKAAKLNTADNVQNHGAIGFTAEHDAGLYARRAHMLEYCLGGDVAAASTLLAASQHRFETLPPVPAEWFGPTRTA